MGEMSQADRIVKIYTAADVHGMLTLQKPAQRRRTVDQVVVIWVVAEVRIENEFCACLPRQSEFLFCNHSLESSLTIVVRTPVDSTECRLRFACDVAAHFVVASDVVGQELRGLIKQLAGVTRDQIFDLIFSATEPLKSRQR
jgi:hypothetical protein